MWPTEPAKAGWSSNKWQKTKLRRKQLPLHQPSSRHRKDHVWAVALAAAAVPAVVVVEAVVDAAALEAAVLGAVVDPAAAVDRAAVGREVRAVSAAEEAGTAKVVIAMADAATVEASSSRT